jgi:hypothetical protein
VNIPLDAKENDEHVLDFALHPSRLSQSAMNPACHSDTLMRLTLSSPTACLIIARVSVSLFPKFAQSSVLLHCQILREIALGQINCRKISTSTQLHEIFYTVSQDMLILSTVALRYYNCCLYGNTSPGNYGYPSYVTLLTSESFAPIQNQCQNYSLVYSNFYVFGQQTRRQKVLDRMVVSVTSVSS